MRGRCISSGVVCTTCGHRCWPRLHCWPWKQEINFGLTPFDAVGRNWDHGEVIRQATGTRMDDLDDPGVSRSTSFDASDVPLRPSGQYLIVEARVVPSRGTGCQLLPLMPGRHWQDTNIYGWTGWMNINDPNEARCTSVRCKARVVAGPYESKIQ